MKNSFSTPARSYSPGIGDAVADRTYNRKIIDKGGFQIPFNFDPENTASFMAQLAAVAEAQGAIVRSERWEEVALRVARGNVALRPEDAPYEFDALHHHLRQASILMSGRHLQHGDESQPGRPLEVFTNCSTSAATFLTFYLLLNGSGVGRAYDDDLIVVDFNFMPLVVPVIDMNHPDVRSGEVSFFDAESAKHLYAGRTQHYFRVPDSREGWAKAIEQIEMLTFPKTHREDVLILDFSDVRGRGSPIKGMQNRPASGPCPLMVAIANMARLRDAGMKPWRAAMFADHYASECVLVGGARRAARMSTKTWRDKSVLDFIGVKRGGFLWSSNNSVTVDEVFWKRVGQAMKGVTLKDPKKEAEKEHAMKVFEAICWHSYHDRTGEPGIINQHMLVQNTAGMKDLMDGDFAESDRYKLEEGSKDMMAYIARRFAKKKYHMITNPCGEIALTMLGGYCVIGDVVPFHAVSDEDAEDAFRASARALIRANLMNALYHAEVKRTNRIGVGMTGIHEYAWSRFGFGFRDLIDEEKAKDFWLMLSRFKRAVRNEAKAYSEKLGVAVPHTDTTMKPSGTISKLFMLTEGAHLPAMREYVRWVQFRNDDPLVDEYRKKGYPIKKLQTYGGTTVVGFPTVPTICTLGMGDKLVTAAEATPEEQYQWLRLLEKYWIVGVEEDGVTPLPDTGNQVSYTLKYKPEAVNYDQFKKAIFENQPTVRCASVMPQIDSSAYEYQPEQPVSKHEFEVIAQAIRETANEDVGREHVDCAGGACPIDFRAGKAA